VQETRKREKEKERKRKRVCKEHVQLCVAYFISNLEGGRERETERGSACDKKEIEREKE